MEVFRAPWALVKQVGPVATIRRLHVGGEQISRVPRHVDGLEAAIPAHHIRSLGTRSRRPAAHGRSDGLPEFVLSSRHVIDVPGAPQSAKRSVESRPRSRRTSRAALYPGMPETPPPGCTEPPHRYRPLMGVR